MCFMLLVMHSNCVVSNRYCKVFACMPFSCQHWLALCKEGSSCAKAPHVSPYPTYHQDFCSASWP